MSDHPTAPTPVLDADTIAFAGRCFDLARSGHTADLEVLLDQGLPANLTNDKGDTLLILASYHGHHETAAMLLAHGADPDRHNDRGQTALAAASFKGAERVILALLEKGLRSMPVGRTAERPSWWPRCSTGRASSRCCWSVEPTPTALMPKGAARSTSP